MADMSVINKSGFQLAQNLHTSFQCESLSRLHGAKNTDKPVPEAKIPRGFREFRGTSLIENMRSTNIMGRLSGETAMIAERGLGTLAMEAVQLVGLSGDSMTPEVMTHFVFSAVIDGLAANLSKRAGLEGSGPEALQEYQQKQNSLMEKLDGNGGKNLIARTYLLAGNSHKVVEIHDKLEHMLKNELPFDPEIMRLTSKLCLMKLASLNTGGYKGTLQSVSQYILTLIPDKVSREHTCELLQQEIKSVGDELNSRGIDGTGLLQGINVNSNQSVLLQRMNAMYNLCQIVDSPRNGAGQTATPATMEQNGFPQASAFSGDEPPDKYRNINNPRLLSTGVIPDGTKESKESKEIIVAPQERVCSFSTEYYSLPRMSESKIDSLNTTRDKQQSSARAPDAQPDVLDGTDGERDLSEALSNLENVMERVSEKEKAEEAARSLAGALKKLVEEAVPGWSGNGNNLPPDIHSQIDPLNNKQQSSARSPDAQPDVPDGTDGERDLSGALSNLENVMERVSEKEKAEEAARSLAEAFKKLAEEAIPGRPGHGN